MMSMKNKDPEVMILCLLLMLGAFCIFLGFITNSTWLNLIGGYCIGTTIVICIDRKK